MPETMQCRKKHTWNNRKWKLYAIGQAWLVIYDEENECLGRENLINFPQRFLFYPNFPAVANIVLGGAIVLSWGTEVTIWVTCGKHSSSDSLNHLPGTSGILWRIYLVFCALLYLDNHFFFFFFSFSSV